MLDIQWVLMYLILGSFVGIIAGLLGVGGGAVLVPILTAIFLSQGIDVEFALHLALGTSMATIIFTSVSSLRAHKKKNGVLWSVFKNMAPGIILGAFLATFIVAKVNVVLLAIFFSLFMMYISFQMFKNKKPNPSRGLMEYRGLFFSGIGIGAISSLVSIGGGSLSVPFLIWQNIDIRKAIGTSAAIGLPISLSGTLGYVLNGYFQYIELEYTVGYVYLPAVFFIAIMSFIFAPLGAKLAHTLPTSKIKKIFSILLVILSVKMLTSVLS